MAYDRPENRFAYLGRAGRQITLEEIMAPGRRWVTAPLERPFGRGINFQITVDDVAPILASLDDAGWPCRNLLAKSADLKACGFNALHFALCCRALIILNSQLFVSIVFVGFRRRLQC